MNMVPLLALPYASVVCGLNAFKYHPDFKVVEGIGYVNDLRENYLPAQSYGNAYLPFIKPVIGIMPGLSQKSPDAEKFFKMREYYLVNSHRFTWGMINLTACAVAAIFVSTLVPAFAVATGAGIIFTYLVVAKLINGYYETKADEYTLENASADEKSAALGLIQALEAKANEVRDIRVFPVLRGKLEAAGVQQTPMPEDIFAAHDERKSTMGLPYTMRPSMDKLDNPANDEAKALFLDREMFHYNLENSELLKVVAMVGFVTVTVTVATVEFLFSPLLFIAGAVYMYGFYSVSHLAGDYYFKKTYDLEDKIGSYLATFSQESQRVYRGAY